MKADAQRVGRDRRRPPLALAQHLCLVVLGDRPLATFAVIGRRFGLALLPAQPLELQILTLTAVRARNKEPPLIRRLVLCQRRRQTSPDGGARVGQVSASFYPRIASLFGLREPLLRPDLRSPQPSRAAAVKEARRAPRSGAQRPGRPRARRHPHRSRTTRQLSRQTIVTSRPPATGNAVVRRLGADFAAIAVRF